MSKYELIDINGKSISVDMSMLIKSQSMFFNATPMAKQFNRRPDDFWKQEQNQKYLNALITLSQGNKENFVITRRGKVHGGTWLHNDLALQFARWLDPFFAVHLDQWIVKTLEEEHKRKSERLASKTGSLPLTYAITRSKENPKPYHFSNEFDMFNRIVLGMTAKQYREKYKLGDGVALRDHLEADELAMIAHLQRIDTGLVEIGMEYQERKEHLERCFEKGLERLPRLREIGVAA